MTVLKHKLDPEFTLDIAPPTEWEWFLEALVLVFAPFLRLKAWNFIDRRRWSRTMNNYPLIVEDLVDEEETPHECPVITCTCSTEQACWWCEAEKELVWS